MNVLPPRSSMSPKTSIALSSGPVTWGLIAGIVAGAGILLSCFSPILGVAGLAVLSIAIVGKTANDCRNHLACDEPTESWEESVARIGVYAESLEAERQAEQLKFQTMILSQKRAGGYHFH